MSASSTTEQGRRPTAQERLGHCGPLERAAGYAAAGILAGGFGIHMYWALGGKWAAAAGFGSTELPSGGIVAVVAALIAAASLFLLVRSGALVLPLPAGLLRWGSWALVVAFGLVAIGNLTAPADSYARGWHVFFFGPLLLVLAVLCAVVARSPIPRRRRS